MRKRITVFLLFLCIAALCCVSASAETYSGECGENVFWELDTSTGALTISGSGAMDDYRYAYINAPWIRYRSDVHSVLIQNGVTTIGNAAFRGCTKLKSITVPDCVTSIGDDTFDGCTSLESITIPDRVTCIGNNTFDGCTSLKSITIPDGVTSIGDQAFSFCALTSITIPDRVTSIGDQAFLACHLTSITIPDSVTSIGSAPFLDNPLTSIQVEDGNPFYYSENNCLIETDRRIVLSAAALPSITIPDGVTRIVEDVFSSHTNHITIPDSVTVIDDFAFSGCFRLTSVTIPDSITYMGARAFWTCPLREVYYSGTKAQWEKISGNSDIYMARIHFGSYGPATEVQFRLCDGTGTEYTVSTDDLTFSYVQSNSDVFIPTRDGYQFDGWYTNANYSGQMYVFSHAAAPVALSRIKQLAAERTVKLYAKWKLTSNHLDERDLFSFTNSPDYFCYGINASLSDRIAYDLGKFHYDIWNCDIIKLKSYATGEEIEDIEATRNSKWNGSCFGMSAFVCLAKAGQLKYDYKTRKGLDVSDLQITYNPYSAPSDCSDVESDINYYHFSASFDGMNVILASEQSAMQWIVHYTQTETLPFIITLTLTGNKTEGRHAVVAYDYEYDSILHNSSMKIYDPSLGNYTLAITEDDGIYSKECSDWEAAWKKYGFSTLTFDIAYSVSDLLAPFEGKRWGILEKLQQYADSFEQNQAVLSDEIAGIFTPASGLSAALDVSYRDFTLTCGEKTAVISDGVIISDEIGLTAQGNQGWIDGTPEYRYLLPFNGDPTAYAVTSSGTDNIFITSFSLNGTENDFLLRTTAENPGTLRFDTEGGMTVEYTEVTEQYTEQFLWDTELPWHIAEFSCKNTGFTLTQETDGTVYEAAEPSAVTISAGDSFNSCTFENVSVNAGGVLLTESGDRVCTVISNGVAVSSAPLTYCVVFDSGFGPQIPDAYVERGEYASEPEMPLLPGYVFTGWYADEARTREWDFSLNPVTENTVLYAGWRIDTAAVHTVTFRSLDGSDEIYYVADGADFPENEIPDIPTSDGHRFHWEAVDLCSVSRDLLICAEELPSVIVELGEESLTYTVQGLSGAAKIIAARYENGKMAGVTTLEVSANSSGTVGLPVLPDNVYKVFLMDAAGLSPLCESWESTNT